MGRTACTEPQCLYKGALYLTAHLCHHYMEWGMFLSYRTGMENPAKDKVILLYKSKVKGRPCTRTESLNRPYGP